MLLNILHKNISIDTGKCLLKVNKADTQLIIIVISRLCIRGVFTQCAI